MRIYTYIHIHMYIYIKCYLLSDHFEQIIILGFMCVRFLPIWKFPWDFLYTFTLHWTVKMTLSLYLRIVTKKYIKKNQLDSSYVLWIWWSILNAFSWDDIKQTLISFLSHACENSICCSADLTISSSFFTSPVGQMETPHLFRFQFSKSAINISIRTLQNKTHYMPFSLQ